MASSQPVDYSQDALNKQIAALGPGYQDALRGVPGNTPFPKGADGLVLPGFRKENARAYARDNGVEFGTEIRNDGTTRDQNRSAHWYTDPRWIGPIAVGGLTAGAAAFGSGAAAAPAAATAGDAAAPAVGGTAAGVDAAGAGLLPSTTTAATAGVLPAGVAPASGGVAASVPFAGNALGTPGADGVVAGDVTNGVGGGSSILSNAQRAQQLGQVINGINSGRQQGREAEANATTKWDQNANVRYNNAINAAKLNLSAGGQRAATSVQGDILANAKPLTLTGQTQMVGHTPVPQTSGGLSSDLFSPNTRALGGLLSQQALQQQQTNDGRAIEPQDPLTPLPKATGLDTGLGILGAAASLYGAYSGASSNPYSNLYPYARRT